METFLIIVVVICLILLTLGLIGLFGAMINHYKAMVKQSNAIADHYSLSNELARKQPEIRPGFRTSETTIN